MGLKDAPSEGPKDRGVPLGKGVLRTNKGHITLCAIPQGSSWVQRIVDTMEDLSRMTLKTSRKQ
jgi:hypothetical protein